MSQTQIEASAAQDHFSMGHILLATLGQRPEAITIALDVLSQSYTFSHLVILHTEPRTSGIAQALDDLKGVLRRDYRQLGILFEEIKGSDDAPLIDIADQKTSEAYYRGVYRKLYQYRQQAQTLHLLVAGGRKAMSIYATLAASLVFRGRDSVWTVLSSEVLLKSGVFHIPAGYQDEVQVVELPLLIGHVVSDIDPWELIQNQQNLRENFRSCLTRQEIRLVDLLMRHPYASDKELSELLVKSYRTVQNQFASIYGKMVGFFHDNERITDKRRLLIDLMKGEFD